VDCAETDAEMLLLKDYRNIFKHTLTQADDVELARRHRFERQMWIQF
jgi:hypothetical protein